MNGWSGFETIAGYGYMSGPWSQMTVDVPAQPANPAAVVETPSVGTRTGRQSILPPSSPLHTAHFEAGCAGAVGGLPDTSGLTPQTTLQYTNGRLASSYHNYRQMRKDPIVAIGREMADCLVCTNKWSYEAKDSNYAGGDEELDEMIAFVRDFWEGIAGFDSGMQPVTFREHLLAESTWAKDYGNHTLEVVYGDAPDGSGTTVTALLPCLPENTSPLVVTGTRRYAGVRNRSVNGVTVDLEPRYCVRFVYDGEGGDLFGRSRFENVKEWIQIKWDIRDKIVTDLNTTIGNIMDVGFPMHPNAETEQANADTAAKIGIGLARGQTVVRPVLSVDDQLTMIRNGFDPSKVQIYPVTRVDTGQNNADGFKTMCSLVDEQILFGFLVLPRTVKEAEHGAKADAQEHTESQEMFSERWISCVVGAAQLVTDELLAIRYGPDKRGAVRIKANPIDDEVKGILENILTTLLQGNQDLALRVVDVKAALAKLNIRTLAEFDQAELAKVMGAKGAGDALSNRAKLRAAGYDDAEAEKVMNEKRTEDAVPADPDMLGGRK